MSIIITMTTMMIIPITWERRSYLYVQAWSSDQWGSIYQWWTMLILVDEKFEGEIVMLGPSWHGTCQLWKGGINSLYTCYLSNLKRSRILKNVVQWESKQFTIFEIMKNLQMQSLCITRPGMLKTQGNMRICFKAVLITILKYLQIQIQYKPFLRVVPK